MEDFVRSAWAPWIIREDGKQGRCRLPWPNMPAADAGGFGLFFYVQYGDQNG